MRCRSCTCLACEEITTRDFNRINAQPTANDACKLVEVLLLAILGLELRNRVYVWSRVSMLMFSCGAVLDDGEIIFQVIAHI
jgi:hypothetical protein